MPDCVLIRKVLTVILRVSASWVLLMYGHSSSRVEKCLWDSSYTVPVTQWTLNQGHECGCEWDLCRSGYQWWYRVLRDNVWTMSCSMRVWAEYVVRYTHKMTKCLLWCYRGVCLASKSSFGRTALADQNISDTTLLMSLTTPWSIQSRPAAYAAKADNLAVCRDAA